jgi:hypothetical protein
MKRAMTLAALLCAALNGCATIGSTPSVAMNVRQDYTKDLQSVFVVLRTDEIPSIFVDHFATSLEQLLEARGVTTQLALVSELDLRPVTREDARDYSHVMVIRPTQLHSNQHALQSVTMNCSLLESDSELLVMRAEVVANKGWGFGFGESEAVNATQELVRQMEQRGLVRGLPAPSPSR